MASLADGVRICGDCGRRIAPDDDYCAGCGAELARRNHDRVRREPGFAFFLEQGLGWGLGFAIASAIVTFVSLLVWVALLRAALRL